MWAVRRTVGVLGGMGPQATVDFLDKVIAVTPVEVEQDHLRMLVHFDPTIPNRHRSIAGAGPSAERPLANLAAGLEAAGADFLVMPSHTPHAYSEAIRSRISIPFVSMVELTCEEIARAHTGAVIGLLAAEGCLAAGFYQSALSKRGIGYIHLDAKGLGRFMRAVFDVKTNRRVDAAAAELRDLAQELIGSGADLLVAACTEVPLLLDAESIRTPLVDPTHLLAKETVRLGLGGELRPCVE